MLEKGTQDLILGSAGVTKCSCSRERTLEGKGKGLQDHLDPNQQIQTETRKGAPQNVNLDCITSVV